MSVILIHGQDSSGEDKRRTAAGLALEASSGKAQLRKQLAVVVLEDKVAAFERPGAAGEEVLRTAAFRCNRAAFPARRGPEHQAAVRRVLRAQQPASVHVDLR